MTFHSLEQKITPENGLKVKHNWQEFWVFSVSNERLGMGGYLGNGGGVWPDNPLTGILQMILGSARFTATMVEDGGTGGFVVQWGGRNTER